MWYVVEAVASVGASGLVMDTNTEVYAVPTSGGVESIYAMGAGIYASYLPIDSRVKGHWWIFAREGPCFSLRAGVKGSQY
jgi:hypothetical protein